MNRYLDLTVLNEFGKSYPAKGKIDTGADCTIIPNYLVRPLDLESTGTTLVMTADGAEKTFHNYFISIAINGIKFESFEVIAMEKEYVLLGRDLINLWKLVIDGESETFTIEPWSTDPDDAFK